jgi:hypothetical protein
MALDADDWEVDITGNIRWSGGGTQTNVTVLELHRFLQDLADDAVATASTNDFHDITDETSSDRSTDNIITLTNGYNIDDTAAEHIFDGSISQDNGDTVYSGLVVVGAVVSGTELQIVQDNKLLKNYWGSGLNADAAANILLRVMVKTREYGADVDGQRLRVQARELGDTYAEFSLTAGLGNSTAAIFTGTDLNNATAASTIVGYDQFTNTEGYQLIDIDGDGSTEPYYAQWLVTGGGSTPASPTINDLFEYTKYIQHRTDAVDAVVATGTNYIADNGTITSQAGTFTAETWTGGQKLSSVRMRLKDATGTPTGFARVTVWDDSASAPNAIVATSELVNVNILTASYQEIEFVFNDNVTLSSAGTYYAAIENVDATGTAVGSAGNNFHAEGNATGTDRHEYNVSWGAAAAGNLWMEIYSSPIIHGISGNLFRGITHDITYDGLTGSFTENNLLVWGTEIAYDNEGAAGLSVGEYYEFSDDAYATIKAVGRLLALDDDGATGSCIFGIEPGSSALANDDVFRRADGTANDDAIINATITDDGAAYGRGLILADDATDNIYIQLLSGTAPTDNLPIHDASLAGVYDTATNDALVNVTVTARTISPEFIGTSTGAALIGAYGIAVDPNDTTASDQFFDLGNVLRVPPNNVTFTVSGLVSGEDRVLVGPENGASGLDVDQLSLNANLTTDNITSLVTTEAEPNNTPATGTIRVVDDVGVHRRLEYNNISGAGPTTYTITTTDGNEDFAATNATAGNDVYITYIDKLAAATSESFTTVFDGAQTLFVRVRDGDTTPIKTFETTASLGSGGGTATAIRTSDA